MTAKTGDTVREKVGLQREATVANISVGLIIATFFTLCIWVIVTAIRDLIN